MGTHPIFESDFDCLTEIEILKEWPTKKSGMFFSSQFQKRRSSKSTLKEFLISLCMKRAAAAKIRTLTFKRLDSSSKELHIHGVEKLTFSTTRSLTRSAS